MQKDADYDKKTEEEVTGALVKTAGTGFAFTGEVVSTSSKEHKKPWTWTRAMARVRHAVYGDPLSGKLSGAVTAPFRASARVQLANGCYEIFHEGGRTMERLLCPAGTIDPPIDAAAQFLFFLNLEDLATSVGTHATRAGAGGEAMVGDVKCRRFDVAVSDMAFPYVILSEEDAKYRYQQETHEPDRTLNVTAWLGTDDGLVHRLQVVFHYQQKHKQMPVLFSGDISFDMTLKKHGAAEAEIPPTVAKPPARELQSPLPETPSQEAKHDEQAAAEAATALRKTGESGFAFTGEVVSPIPDEEAGARAASRRATNMIFSAPLSGTLSGSVAAPFRVSARVQSAGGGYEIFHEGDRLMERLLCPAGAIDPPLDAIPQCLLILNLEQLAKSVEKLATRAGAGGESMVGGVPCHRIDMALPEHAFPVVDPVEKDPTTIALRKALQIPDRTVNLTTWVGNDDGQVHRLQAVFHYRNWASWFTGDVTFNMTLDKHGNGGKEAPR